MSDTDNGRNIHRGNTTSVSIQGPDSEAHPRCVARYLSKHNPCQIRTMAEISIGVTQPVSVYKAQTAKRIQDAWRDIFQNIIHVRYGQWQKYPSGNIHRGNTTSVSIQGPDSQAHPRCMARFLSKHNPCEIRTMAEISIGVTQPVSAYKAQTAKRIQDAWRDIFQNIIHVRYGQWQNIHRGNTTSFSIQGPDSQAHPRCVARYLSKHNPCEIRTMAEISIGVTQPVSVYKAQTAKRIHDAWRDFFQNIIHVRYGQWQKYPSG
ncbi:hypothetical protein J6590_020279 [Homalodisca vitripennis]|nr:hypothetical protein J6590_020279 [Homalodisca vitripennis]